MTLHVHNSHARPPDSPDDGHSDDDDGNAIFGAPVMALDTGSFPAGSTTTDSTRLIHSGMADTGNAFGDVYTRLPSHAANVSSTDLTLALADQSRRKVTTSFRSAIFLRHDDSIPVHFTTGYVLPGGSNYGEQDEPIFSIPKWNQLGWGMVLPP